MYNRYINIRKDFGKMNEHANKIMPILNDLEFKTKEDKQLVLNWVHKTFFNQWKVRDRIVGFKKSYTEET